MFTEYIFKNKRYEMAIRDLKASLFDIVTIEKKKFADIREKLENEVSEERCQELTELYAQQDRCLEDILKIADELSGKLELLDSYSKEMEALEDKNIAEIIATLKKSKELNEKNESVVDYEEVTEDSLNNETVEETEVTDEDSMDSETVEETEAADEDSVNSETVEETEVTDEDSMDSETVEESEEVTDEDTMGSEAVEESEEVTDEDTIGSEAVEESEEATDEDTMNSEAVEESEEATDEDTMNSEAVEESEEVTDEDTMGSEAVEESEEVTDEDTMGSEAVEATTLPTSGSVIPAITFENETIQNGEETENNLQNNDEGEVFLPPLNFDNSQANEEQPEEAENQEVNVNNEINIPLIESPLVNKNDSIISNNAQQLNQDDSVETISKLTFIKENNLNVKAILTSKRQIEKLRASKNTQVALLSARGSMGSFEVSQSVISNTPVSEQQLIDSGLLKAPPISKQQQIEEMLVKANELYKEGKVAEAKEMYDLISKLNRENQENSIVK